MLSMKCNFVLARPELALSDNRIGLPDYSIVEARLEKIVLNP